MTRILILLFSLFTLFGYSQQVKVVDDFKEKINWQKVSNPIKATYESTMNTVVINYTDLSNFSVETNWKNSDMKLLQTIKDSSLVIFVSQGSKEKVLPERPYFRGLQELLPYLLWLNNIQYDDSFVSIEAEDNDGNIKSAFFSYNDTIQWEEMYDAGTKLKLGQIYNSIRMNNEAVSYVDQFTDYKLFDGLVLPTIIEHRTGTVIEKRYVLKKVEFK